MRIWLLILLLALVPPAPLPAAPAAPARVDMAAVDRAIQAQMERSGLPGVALAVVAGGEVVALRGYGEAGGEPITPQTQMLIGSQTKSFTALAVAQLAEQGRIALDAPVRRYIPWFAVADPEAGGKITVSHLLHHTSGLSEAGHSVLLPRDATPEEAVRSLAQAHLTAPVGAVHQYFNLGYDTLAYLVEVVSGEPYARYLKAHIFDPLGMIRTTADPAAARELAQGYTRIFGFAAPMRERMPAYEVGAGYIVSTAEDLARFARAMLNEGGGLVSPATARLIFTPGPSGYGLGWYIAPGGAKIIHGGANQTFRAEVNLYPPRDLALVLLANEGHLVDHYVSAPALVGAVEAALFGQAPPAAGGWTARQIGWAAGALTLALCLIHLRSFAALFGGWAERARLMGRARLAADIAVNFIVPTLILLVILAGMRDFFGYRFNLLTTVAQLPFVMPDIFALILVGSLPDYVQGLIKLAWVLGGKVAPEGAGSSATLARAGSV